MQLTIHILGVELLSLALSTDDEAAAEGCELAGGSTGSTPMGFTPSWGDARWERGPGDGEL